MRDNAAARLQIAKDKSGSLIKESNCEAAQASQMEGKRRHKEKMQLIDSMLDAATRSKIIVAGQKGSQILSYYNDAMDQVTKR